MEHKNLILFLLITQCVVLFAPPPRLQVGKEYDARWDAQSSPVPARSSAELEQLAEENRRAAEESFFRKHLKVYNYNEAQSSLRPSREPLHREQRKSLQTRRLEHVLKEQHDEPTKSLLREHKEEKVKEENSRVKWRQICCPSKRDRSRAQAKRDRQSRGHQEIDEQDRQQSLEEMQIIECMGSACLLLVFGVVMIVLIYPKEVFSFLLNKCYA